jgi:hypothetical protein
MRAWLAILVATLFGVVAWSWWRPISLSGWNLSGPARREHHYALELKQGRLLVTYAVRHHDFARGWNDLRPPPGIHAGAPAGNAPDFDYSLAYALMEGRRLAWDRSIVGPGETTLAVVLPLWVAPIVLAVPLGLIASRAARRRSWRRNGCCVRCGYDLRESPARCPECGDTGVPPATGPRWPRLMAASLLPPLAFVATGVAISAGFASSREHWRRESDVGVLSLQLENIAYQGDVAAVRELLDRGALPDGSNICSSPLNMAIRKGRVDVIRLLLDRGANPRLRRADGSAAFNAANSRHRDMLLPVLAEYGLRVDPESGNEVSPPRRPK